MKAEYDKETDTLTITLRDARVKESDEIRPGVIADFGYDGGVVGFEVLRSLKNSRTSRRNAVRSHRPLITRGPCGLRRFFRYSFLSFFALSDNGEQYDPCGLSGSILTEGRFERQFSVSDLG